MFVAGISNGTRVRWFENGKKKSEARIVDGVVTGEYQEWHDNGQLAVRMVAENGKPNGIVESWHRSGALKSRATMKLGEVVHRQFFPDAIAQAPTPEEPANEYPLTVTIRAVSALLAVSLFGAPANSAPLSTSPVGFFTVNIAGTHGEGADALTFLGLSLAQPIVFHTSVASYDATQQALACTNFLPFTNDQFAGANGRYFAEIVSGPNAGLMSDIVSSSGSTIVVADDWTGKFTGNEKLKIRKHWTLQSFFGPNSHTGGDPVLRGGPVTAADEVLIFDRAAQKYVTYYYKQGGLTGGSGWRSTAGPDPLNTDCSNQILPLTDGIIVRRKASADVVLPVPR